MKKNINILFFVITLTFISCSWEFFSVPDDKNGEAWGLKSAEVVKELKFHTEEYDLTIDYKARVTSRKYGINILFPEIRRSNDSVYDKIDQQFDGFSCKIYDVTKQKAIDSIALTDSKGIKSFLGRDSLVGELPFILHFKKNNIYRFIFHIPKIKTKDEQHALKVIMAIGTENSVYL